MPLDTPKKRRMWVLPSPTGSVTVESRAPIVMYYPIISGIIRSVKDLAALFIAGLIGNIFVSPRRQLLFSSAEKKNVFVSSDSPSSFVGGRK